MTSVSSDAQARLRARIYDLSARRHLLSLCRDVQYGMDRRDEARFLSAFHEDGVFDCGPGIGEYAGHDALRTFLTTHIWVDMPITRHYVKNATFVISGDRATGITDQDILLGTSTGLAILFSSPQYDDYERRDGVWRIARRKVWPAHTARLGSEATIA
ncbi:MAG: hypothetical protein JWO37_3719 [Acidimicrobiales bacterium]|jgi:gamma-hexachlorocyclohexane dehydrochlorinase|nr:hypothetical protein [Acidimicrobiales bacterium]